MVMRKTLTLREVYDYIHLLGIRIKSDFSCLSKLITEISHGQFSNLSDFENQASKLLSDLENLKTASFKLETKEVLELSRFISLINNPTLSSIINNSKEIKSIFENIIDSVNDKFRIQLKNQKRGKLGKTPKHTAIKRLFTSNKRLSRSTKHSSTDLAKTNSNLATQKSQIENLVLKLSQNNLNISEQDKSNLSDLITQYLSDLKEKIDSTFSLEENCNLQESNLFSELSDLRSIKNPQLQTILTNFFTKYHTILKKDIRAAKHLKNENTSILKNAQNTLHCIFKPNKDKTSKQKMPIEDTLTPEDSSPQMTRRGFLGLAVKTGAVVGGTAAGLGIASKALAGGEDPVELTFPYMEKAKTVKVVAGLDNKGFLEIYKHSKVLQREIPKYVVQILNDGDYSNYEGRGINLMHDGRLSMKVKKGNGPVLRAYTNPLSKSDQKTIGKEIDKYLDTHQ